MEAVELMRAGIVRPWGYGETAALPETFWRRFLTAWNTVGEVRDKAQGERKPEAGDDNAALEASLAELSE